MFDPAVSSQQGGAGCRHGEVSARLGSSRKSQSGGARLGWAGLEGLIGWLGDEVKARAGPLVLVEKES